jgi:hypothetical protein
MPRASSGKSQSPPQPTFQAIHFAAIGFVIISQKVQNAMQDEDMDFSRQATAEGAGVASRDSWGNRDIAQKFVAQFFCSSSWADRFASLFGRKR